MSERHKQIKMMKMKYPWVTADRTQAEGSYEIFVALAENVHISVYLDKKEFQNLADAVNHILDFEKGKL